MTTKKIREYLYEKNDLGAKIKEDNQVEFKVWSPTTKNIELFLYNKNNCNEKISSFAMKRDIDGIWTTTINPKDLNLDTLERYFYQYEIEFFNGEKRKGLDPYAKSMASFQLNDRDKIGKAAIVDMASKHAGKTPESIGDIYLASPTDIIIYEIHVRDFTIDTNVENAGTFLGFANFEEGIEHLKELGVTHVQFLPVQNYYTVDEKEKDYFHGKGNYNWGYDPHNYFTLEGWLSANQDDPYERIKEFRALVNKLHENGIGVIIDVVYNHTFGWEIFENIAPGCYYRYEGLSKRISSKTGAGPTLESRNKMVRKLIIDSLKFFVKEYGVDGFRFDLMGFLDVQTMIEIRKALWDRIILHGEAWNFTDLPLEDAPIKGIPASFPHDINLALYNDSTRDSYAGKELGRGFVQGEYGWNSICKAGIIGNIINYFDNSITIDAYHRFAHEPNETLQYLTIHDGFTLWDKINLSVGGSKKNRAKIMKQAFAMLFTSQGKIIIQGGSEIARSKPLSEDDPTSHRAHTSSNVVPNDDGDLKDIYYFHENSYSSSDFVNKIRWSRKEIPLFKNIYEYCSGLIKIRRAIPSLRFSTSQNIKNGLKFILTNHIKSYKFIAYELDNTIEDTYGKKIERSKYKKIIVVHNVSEEALSFRIQGVNANWDILADGERSGMIPIDNSDILLKKNKITVPAGVSAIIAT